MRVFIFAYGHSILHTSSASAGQANSSGKQERSRGVRGTGSQNRGKEYNIKQHALKRRAEIYIWKADLVIAIQNLCSIKQWKDGNIHASVRITSMVQQLSVCTLMLLL